MSNRNTNTMKKNSTFDANTKLGAKSSDSFNSKYKRNRRRSGNSNQSNGSKPSDEGKFPNAKIVDTNNDPALYYNDEKVLQDVASFSFATSLGTRLRVDRIYPDNPASGNLASIPGVMAIAIGITPGVSVDAQSPLNLAAQNVYSFVRYKNSGSKNYDAPDLMLYLLALDSVYAAWNWMKRIYGEASQYSAVNRYMPKALLEAEGIDADDIFANLADYRGYLNMVAQRISAFCVPATMKYFIRHSWLFSNIFTDSNTSKAQIYMYVPKFFYTYDEMSSPTGGKLVPILTAVGTEAKWKFADLRNLMDKMINNLQYSEDIGVMSGDILKAYENKLFTVSTFDADYTVRPVYSAEVLTQFENLQFVPGALAQAISSGWEVTQDPNTNFLKYQPKASTTNRTREGGFINFHFDSPSPKDTIVATRLMQTTVGDGTAQTLTSCGSEVALFGTIYYYTQDSTWDSSFNVASMLKLHRVQSTNEWAIGSSITEQDVVNNLSYLWLWQAFDWAPEFYWLAAGSAGGNAIAFPPFKDWDVYTQIDPEDIASMHELALLSEFNIPN